MNSNFNDELNNKNNNSILVVTEDLETIKSLKDGFNNKYNVTYFYNDKFYLLDGDINSFDLIIFDKKYWTTHKTGSSFRFFLFKSKY